MHVSRQLEAIIFEKYLYFYTFILISRPMNTTDALVPPDTQQFSKKDNDA